MKKQLLEAAFDDEVDEIVRLMAAEQENMEDILEISDTSGNSLVSEGEPP